MPQSRDYNPSFDTPLGPVDETLYRLWKKQYAPTDPGADYDYRGAYAAGQMPMPPSGHWTDKFKKPNYPTFSEESQYAGAAPERAGRWEGDKYVPAGYARGTDNVGLSVDDNWDQIMDRMRRREMREPYPSDRGKHKFDPGDVPIVPADEPGNLMYDPYISGREDAMLMANRGANNVMAQRGTDSVDAKLTPHEAVLTRNGAEIIGRDKIRQANAFGNHLAQRGIDLPTIHAQFGNEDINMNGYEKGSEDVKGADQLPSEYKTKGFWEAVRHALFADTGGDIEARGRNSNLMSYGPRYAPPVTEEIPGYARKRITDELGLQHFPARPYYEPPGVGVAPSMVAPASGYAFPGHPAQYGDPGNYVPPPQAYYAGGISDVPQPCGGNFGGRGGGGMNMRMFATGTEDVVPYWDPATGQMVTDANDARTHIYGTNPPVAPPPPPIVNNPVTAAAASKWTPEQKAVVDRIYSGREDYTFGPGSPNPSKEDLGTYVRGPHAPAAGFQQERGVALPKNLYNLFNPEQRRELGIMDIAPDWHGEGIERWYGTPTAWAGGGGDPGLTQRAGPTQGSFAQIQNGVYSMDPQGDYAKATAGTSPGGPSKFGEGVGTAGKMISSIGQGYTEKADQDMQKAVSQALSMIGGISGNAYGGSPLDAYYKALSGSTGFSKG